MRNKTKGWSEERRRKQAENMRKSRPWEKTSGPKTLLGKATSSRNAFKHGLRSADIIWLRASLKMQADWLQSSRVVKNLPFDGFS